MDYSPWKANHHDPTFSSLVLLASHYDNCCHQTENQLCVWNSYFNQPISNVVYNIFRWPSCIYNTIQSKDLGILTSYELNYFEIARIVNSVIDGGTTNCHNDNLWHCLWGWNWHSLKANFNSLHCFNANMCYKTHSFFQVIQLLKG